MSDPETFLSRWSRLKQEAEQTKEPAGDRKPGTGAPDVDTKPEVAKLESARSKNAPEQEFDISTLPPIDSIGVDTDIRSFLQKGVPLELTRAALRRAWTSDPAIRDFIEVAENQWDFATGSNLPGFGNLDLSDDVRRMIAEMFQAPSRATKKEPAKETSNAPANKPETSIDGDELRAAEPVAEQADPQEEAKSIVHREEQNIAMQQGAKLSSTADPAKPRHGGALPK